MVGLTEAVAAEGLEWPFVPKVIAALCKAVTVAVLVGDPSVAVRDVAWPLRRWWRRRAVLVPAAGETTIGRVVTRLVAPTEFVAVQILVAATETPVGVFVR